MNKAKIFASPRGRLRVTGHGTPHWGPGGRGDTRLRGEGPVPAAPSLARSPMFIHRHVCARHRPLPRSQTTGEKSKSHKNFPLLEEGRERGVTAQGAGQCQQRGTPNEGSDPKKQGVGFDIVNKGGGLLQRQHRQHRPPSRFAGCPGDVTMLLARCSQGTGHVARTTHVQPPGCSGLRVLALKKSGLE